jgi:hypothetical protein
MVRKGQLLPLRGAPRQWQISRHTALRYRIGKRGPYEATRTIGASHTDLLHLAPGRGSETRRNPPSLSWPS